MVHISSSNFGSCSSLYYFKALSITGCIWWIIEINGSWIMLIDKKDPTYILLKFTSKVIDFLKVWIRALLLGDFITHSLWLHHSKKLTCSKSTKVPDKVSSNIILASLNALRTSEKLLQPRNATLTDCKQKEFK